MWASGFALQTCYKLLLCLGAEKHNRRRWAGAVA